MNIIDFLNIRIQTLTKIPESPFRMKFHRIKVKENLKRPTGCGPIPLIICKMSFAALIHLITAIFAIVTITDTLPDFLSQS